MSPLSLLKPRFSGTPAGSQLLAQLPRSAREALKPHLRPVTLECGQSIFHANHPLRTVYFPETCVVAMLTQPEDGETIDIAMVGRDGMVGVALLPGVNVMPCDATVEIAGGALAVSGEELKRVVRQSPEAHELFGRYAYTLFAQGVQLAGCNSFHQVEARCARCLLTIQDLAGRDEFPLTHDRLAAMLGVRRPSVTHAAGALHRRGLISYRYGVLRVADRRGLLRAACECYRASRVEAYRVLGY